MDTVVSMKVFREVVERGSFVAAAARLDLSTAMASKHVMNIEQRLGARLLNRSSRSLSLTEPGRIYFEHCKTILEELEQAESAIGSLGGAPRGTLRVTCPSWMTTRRMAEFLAAHRGRYPDVVIDVTFEDRIADIVEEGYDLALRSTVESLPDGLIARPLRAVPLVIAASTKYLLRRGTPKLPRDLAQHDSVMVGSGHTWRFMGPTGSIEVPAHVVLRLSSTSAAAHAVSTGIGVAALPVTVIEDPQFSGVLQPILTDHPLRYPTLFAVYGGRKLLSPKIRTFIDHLIEYVAEVPAPRTPEARNPEALSNSGQVRSAINAELKTDGRNNGKLLIREPFTARAPVSHTASPRE